MTPEQLAREGLEVSINVIRRLKQTALSDPFAAQNLLRAIWKDHIEDYRLMLNGTPAGKPEYFIALNVLHAYFNELGDWAKMIQLLEGKIKKL
jgi:hypothetical protein